MRQRGALGREVISWASAAALAAVLAAVLAAAGSGGAAEPVAAAFETRGYLDAPSDGQADADDPAIWVNRAQPERSLIVGTLKQGGLAVFDLDGAELQRIAAPPAPGAGDAPGRFNNVDLLLGFSLGGTPVDLAVVTDRGRDRLVVFRIRADFGPGAPPLEDVTAADTHWVFSRSQSEVNEQRTAYGLATQQFADETGAVGFVTQRERARVAQLRFLEAPGGRVRYEVVRSIQFPSVFTLSDGLVWTPCLDEDGPEPQFEGGVIDAQGRAVYLAQERVGIWRVALDSAKRELIERVRSYGQAYERTLGPERQEFRCEPGADRGAGGQSLSADAEGLAIYASPADSARRYLFASSQGDDAFAVWEIGGADGWQPRGRFQIALGDDVNQASDGSHVVSAPLRADYPRGLFVSHDGDDTPAVLDESGQAIPRSGFKLTPVDRILQRLGLQP